VIVDDVMTAGTAVNEAVEIVRSTKAQLIGVLVAMDRRERIEGGVTALERVQSTLGVPARAIVSLEDVIQFLDSSGRDADALVRILDYRSRHCVTPG
jgi:orotate phosphoribosyltransferase